LSNGYASTSSTVGAAVLVVVVGVGRVVGVIVVVKWGLSGSWICRRVVAGVVGDIIWTRRVEVLSGRR
jgi:hypothetical protein